MSEDQTLNVRTLGRSAHLGALYDAHTETFCQGSVFNTYDLPSGLIQAIPNTYTGFKYTTETSHKKKFDLLDVKVELKISVLLGMVSLQGGGQYLREEFSSERTVHMTTEYEIKTVDEKINPFNPSLKQYINLDVLQMTQATHYVTDITWGGNAFAELKCHEVESRSKTRIEAYLKAALKAVITSVEGGGSVELDKVAEDKEYRISILVYGDFLTDDELPLTVGETAKVLGKFPGRLSKTNDGKGIPLTVQLSPISKLIEFFSFEISVNNIYKKLSHDNSSEMEALFEKIEESRCKLATVTSLLNSEAASCLPNDTIKKILNFEQKVQLADAQVRANLKLKVVAIRNGEGEMDSVLMGEVQTFLDSEYGPKKIDEFIDNQKAVKDKLQWYHSLLKRGVKYMVESNGEKIESAFLSDLNLYVLVINRYSNCGLSDRLIQMHHYLLNLLTSQEAAVEIEGSDQFVFFVYEKDETGTECEANIHQYINGELITDDYDGYLKDLVKHNKVTYTVDVELYDSEPEKKKTIEIKCPGSILGQCRTDARKWNCFRCEALIEYGFDEYYYCQCGRENFLACLYFCTDKEHGKESVPFNDEDILKELLEAM